MLSGSYITKLDLHLKGELLPCRKVVALINTPLLCKQILENVCIQLQGEQILAR